VQSSQVEEGQKCSFSCINNTAPNLRAVMVNPRRFYTYAYLREDRTPYYIGKGSGRRAYSKHSSFYPPKDKTKIIYLKQNLTEEEAFRHEIYMIAVFGRKDIGTGILINRTDGGDNPPKNNNGGWNKGITMNFSPQRSKKISNSLKGKEKSKEHKENISNSRRGIVPSNKNNFKLNDEQIQELISSDDLLELSKKFNVSKNYLYGLRKILKQRGYNVKDARSKSEQIPTSLLLSESQLQTLLNSPKASITSLSESWDIDKKYLYNIRYKFKKYKNIS
jgi:tRNA splicing endonuclease